MHDEKFYASMRQYHMRLKLVYKFLDVTIKLYKCDDVLAH